MNHVVSPASTYHLSQMNGDSCKHRDMNPDVGSGWGEHGK